MGVRAETGADRVGRDRRCVGEAEKEAQAREQYFRFEEEAQNSLHGKLVDGTRTNNGSTGGTFRGTGGVYVVERRLRMLIGLPISDGRLIRPSEEPLKAKLVFDGESNLAECLSRRAEIRRQKWQIQKRQAELEANMNFLRPQLDVTGRYRLRGFGKDIYPNGGTGRFNNATSDLVSGDFQEWQAGLELSFPIGFRQAYSAVRHSELQLAREQALLYEQERIVVYDLSNAISETERAYAIVETNMNRRMAAAEQVAAVQTAFEADNATLDSVLDAQRRLSDADISYYRALVEYQLAVKNVHLEKGTLLEYNEIYLSEGAWPSQAYDDAEASEASRGEPLRPLPSERQAPWVSQGTYPQLQSSAEEQAPLAESEAYAPESIETPTETPTETPSEETFESPRPAPFEGVLEDSLLPETEDSFEPNRPKFVSDRIEPPSESPE